MKSINQYIQEGNISSEFTFYNKQMMIAFAGLQCLYNNKNKDAILKECESTEKELDELIEDLSDEINNKNKCNNITKQSI